jgi:spore coat polysaccharide biosynthesis protein SpsF
MKLAAVLACRNQSSRLYAKPLQNLDIKGVTILDYIISQIRMRSVVSDIVLAISEQEENSFFKSVANKHGIKYVLGGDKDVLNRLIKGADLVGADHILRVTTECPYAYFDPLAEIYKHHCDNGIDYSVISGVPNGANPEILSVEALRKSWEQGTEKHRSELCSLYIFENQDKFKIYRYDPPQEFKRLDMRLCVDWPEDLIVMREIYKNLELDPKKQLEFGKVIDFLDKNPKINAINNWINPGIGRIWY